MSRESLAKVLIVVVTAGVCGGLLWWIRAHPPAPSPSAGAADPAGDAAPGGDNETLMLDPAAMPGVVLDEETAKTLFRGVRYGQRQVYDPVAWAVLKPDNVTEWKWPEYPSGKIVLRSNNLGFRKDTDTQVEKQGVRILVAGDSQTDGIVYNNENFCNVLEERLDARPGATHVEVLNAGVGATGPQNYVGTLRNNLYLKPDIFVAVLFTGNDFINALAVSDFFTKRKDGKPTAIKDYQRNLMEANKKWGPVVVDRFNQPLKFMGFPEDADLALQAAVDSFMEMARLCRDNGIRFLAVVLPCKPDVDTDERQTFFDLIASLGMSEEQYGINARLGDRFAEALRAQGVQVLDTTAGLRADAGVPHYWVKDWHLNPAGHAIVAALLQQEIEPLLPK